jgi:hypothetical protein
MKETSSQVQILRADVPTSSMPFSSAICDEIKCSNVVDSCDMQQGGESVSLQDFESVSTPIFRVVYNLNEKRDQMFGLREYLEKKYVPSASLSYGPPWAHCLGGYQDRLLDGPLGLLGLCHAAPDGVGARTAVEKYSDMKLYMSCTM